MICSECARRELVFPESVALVAYWGEALCRGHARLAAMWHDEHGTWPPVPHERPVVAENPATQLELGVV
jgi:hypothetical protein